MSPADRPSDALIEDDAALDQWFEQWMRDVQRAAGKQRGQPILSPQSNIPSYSGA